MEPIILASSSPQRRDILMRLNIPFQVIEPRIDETPPPTLPLIDIPAVLAQKKVAAVRQLPEAQTTRWILGADTVIECDGQLLGKPRDRAQAAAFINKIQGKTHTVRTALALYSRQKQKTLTRTLETRVTMAPLNEREINWYTGTDEWRGAAGGYRIQGYASYFISAIDGTESWVTGLPISAFYAMLLEHGYPLLT